MNFKKYMCSLMLSLFAISCFVPMAEGAANFIDNPLARGTLTMEQWIAARKAQLVQIHSAQDFDSLPQGVRDQFAQNLLAEQEEGRQIARRWDTIHLDEMQTMAWFAPLKNPKIILGATVAVAGIYGAYRVAKVFSDHLKAKLQKPSFVEETNDESFLTIAMNYLLGAETVTREPSKRKVVINEADRAQIEKMAAGIRNAKAFNQPSRHYLFYGPPGVGKTMLARQLAYLSDTTYYIIKASTFVEKDGAEKFRALMRRIRTSGSRAIIFVDEADQLLRHQGELSNDNARVVLNLIKDETGESNNRGATFIFASNMPDHIDNAMKSRLRKVAFKLPDFDSRKKILKNDLKFYFKTDVRSDQAQIDIAEITTQAIEAAARKTDGMSGRDLSLMIEELQDTLIYDEQTTCTLEYFIGFVDAAVAQHKADAELMAETQRDYLGAKPVVQQAAPRNQSARR